ncbi:hypothetical protein H9Y05_00760 [Crocinitomicaceae bacterium CZZ-1]|uniref:GP-PDE domain-containing protein n=1 Tax=Taishania pollutisoli TaxID=2766479 RepID=A0A8J6PHH7_9FLAO|nr:glycerophosphodiester phosphodiesterase family protein [Taishania pollutisoli]MBC9810995.1 hypothetical protein [Taishania pollutisoli]MBX2950152.1 hypothetical protein [Crocinitomicaceae bacterium]NGF76632.1 hypothetical protein [Fluviicola sp. SGL-29]
MRFSLFIITVFLFSCNKQDVHPVEIIGHAGNGLKNPSSIYHANSLEAVELALGTAGVLGVEIDLQLSADNELWLLHDRKLETETTGSGCISEATFETLKKVRFKTVNKERLVRLSDLNFGLYSGKTLYLDIRHYNGCTEALIDQSRIIDALHPIIEAWGTVHFIVTTNHKPWLNGFAAQGWTVYSDIESMSEFQELQHYNLNFHGIMIRNSAAGKDDVTRIQSENKKVILFDIRAPKPIRQALKKHPEGILVDDIKAALIEKSS